MSDESEFYKDWETPDVNTLAKAICKGRGLDPEAKVRDSGYLNYNLVPQWWMYQGRALDFLVCAEALGLIKRK